jgi:hypothetical protein
MKYAPDERFDYCNSGYVVLALLAERASGVAFHDLVDQPRRSGTSTKAFLQREIRLSNLSLRRPP